MPQSTKIGWIELSGNSFAGEASYSHSSWLHALVPMFGGLSTNECGITSDDLISLLGMVKSFPRVHRKLSRWSLDRGASALIKSIPSLFPRIGYCEESIIDIKINPVSGEMMDRLKALQKRWYPL